MKFQYLIALENKLKQKQIISQSLEVVVGVRRYVVHVGHSWSSGVGNTDDWAVGSYNWTGNSWGSVTTCCNDWGGWIGWGSSNSQSWIWYSYIRFAHTGERSVNSFWVSGDLSKVSKTTVDVWRLRGESWGLVSERRSVRWSTVVRDGWSSCRVCKWSSSVGADSWDEASGGTCQGGAECDELD